WKAPRLRADGTAWQPKAAWARPPASSLRRCCSDTLAEHPYSQGRDSASTRARTDPACHPNLAVRARRDWASRRLCGGCFCGSRYPLPRRRPQRTVSPQKAIAFFSFSHPLFFPAPASSDHRPFARPTARRGASSCLPPKGGCFLTTVRFENCEVKNFKSRVHSVYWAHIVQGAHARIQRRHCPGLLARIAAKTHWAVSLNRPANYCSTPPTVLRPVPLQPSSPNRMNFWIRFPVSTSAVYRLPWESMLTWWSQWNSPVSRPLRPRRPNSSRVSLFSTYIVMLELSPT